MGTPDRASTDRGRGPAAQRPKHSGSAAEVLDQGVESPGPGAPVRIGRAGGEGMREEGGPMDARGADPGARQGVVGEARDAGRALVRLQAPLAEAVILVDG